MPCCPWQADLSLCRNCGLVTFLVKTSCAKPCEFLLLTSLGMFLWVLPPIAFCILSVVVPCYINFRQDGVLVPSRTIILLIRRHCSPSLKLVISIVPSDFIFQIYPIISSVKFMAIPSSPVMVLLCVAAVHSLVMMTLDVLRLPCASTVRDIMLPINLSQVGRRKTFSAWRHWRNFPTRRFVERFLHLQYLRSWSLLQQSSFLSPQPLR